MKDEDYAKNDERRKRTYRKKYAPEGSQSRQVKREELNKNFKSLAQKIWKKINREK